MKFNAAQAFVFMLAGGILASAWWGTVLWKGLSVGPNNIPIPGAFTVVFSLMLSLYFLRELMSAAFGMKWALEFNVNPARVFVLASLGAALASLWWAAIIWDHPVAVLASLLISAMILVAFGYHLVAAALRYDNPTQTKG